MKKKPETPEPLDLFKEYSLSRPDTVIALVSRIKGFDKEQHGMDAPEIVWQMVDVSCITDVGMGYSESIISEGPTALEAVQNAIAKDDDHDF